MYARRVDQRDSVWFVIYQYKERTWGHADHKKVPA